VAAVVDAHVRSCVTPAIRPGTAERSGRCIEVKARCYGTDQPGIRGDSAGGWKCCGIALPVKHLDQAWPRNRELIADPNLEALRGGIWCFIGIGDFQDERKVSVFAC